MGYPATMLRTEIETSRGPVLYVCDSRCEKAWGVNGRSHDATSSINFDGEDDVVYLADDEVGDAPRDPGTYEGGNGKPMHPSAHNKWCMRECERCDRIAAGEPILVRDYSVRHYNQPWLHPEAPATTSIDTGEVFRPEGKRETR